MATTNLLQWNPASVNQETDAEYLADSQRAGGATDPSVFLSLLSNKAFYQWSTYLTALFTALANKGFTTSDSNFPTLVAQCAHFLTTADILPPVVNVAYAASVTLNAAVADGFYIQTMTGNLTIAGVTGLTAGQTVALYYQQDGTGGRTVTFPSLFVGASQPDPAPNAVSVQVFAYDANTSLLRPWGPLVSANGAWFPSAVTTSGLLNAASLSIAGAAPTGSLPIGDGTSFLPKKFTVTDVTGSRAQGTTYRNTSAADMELSGFLSVSGGSGDSVVTVSIGSTTDLGTRPWSNTITGTITGEPGGFVARVPQGWYYSVTGTGRFTGTIGSWTEGVYV